MLFQTIIIFFSKTQEILDLRLFRQLVHTEMDSDLKCQDQDIQPKISFSISRRKENNTTLEWHAKFYFAVNYSFKQQTACC